MSDTTYEAGDRVAYSRRFLKSICCYTGEMPQLRGTVREVRKFGDNQMCHVAWDSGPVHSQYEELDDGMAHVIAPNLVLLSRMGTEA